MIREIQALRGLAVILVVFHHLGGWVPSGFVGVDVFFVISGYVVTRSVIRRSEGKNFRFWSFLGDRFVRLAPALVFLVLMVLGFQIYTSPRFSWSGILESGLFSMSYLSNIYSQIKLGDYFGEVAASGPLLHTWSLSVEFQIYIALGLIFLWSMKRTSKRISTVLWLGIFSMLSLGVLFFGEIVVQSIVATEYLSGYYSPLPRFYEVSVGAIIAVLSSRVSVPRIFASLGVAIIVLSAFIPEGVVSWRVVAAIGVIGSALSILGYLSPSKAEGRLMSRGMALVGDYSYSVYLWHWPIWVTVSSIGLSDLAAILISLGFTIVFSWISNVAFERPFLRLRESNGPRLGARQLQVLVAAPLAFISVMVFSIFSFSAAPDNRTGVETAASRDVLDGDVTERGFATDFRKLVKPCLDSSFFVSPNVGKQYFCYQNSSDSDLDVIVLGNSHAGHLIPGLATVFPELSFRYYPISGGISLDNPSVLEAIALIDKHSIKADKVIVNSFWAIEDSTPEDISLVGKRLGFNSSSIVLFNDVPNFKIDPVRCKYKKLFWLPSPCAENLPEFSAHRKNLSGTYSREFPDVGLVDSASFFADGVGTRYTMSLGGSIFFRDGNHLNSKGSVELFKYLKTRGMFF
jgi:peptidoglycan/LPS O-acetylase OafA/YrhL